jgi:hypothetical protein
MWPFAAVLALLLVAGFMKDSKPKRSLHTEAGFKQLVEKTFDPRDVFKMTITMGGEQAPAVSIEKTDDKNWIIPSLYGVKASEGKLLTFIDKIKTLSGEFRSSKKELLEAFAIDDNSAMTIYCEGKDNEVLAKVLIGKSAGTDMSFARLPEDSSVYTVGVDFRKELKITGDSLTTAPESKHFIDSSFLNLKADNVTNISLNLDGKVLEFSKEKVTVPIESGENKNPDEAATELPKTTTQSLWKMTKGPNGLKVKGTAIEEMLRGLNGLVAEDAVDTTTPSDYGLDNSEYQLAITLEGTAEPVKIVAHKSDSEAYVSANNLKTIFKVKSWNFDASMPKTSKMFEYPSTGLDEMKLKKITVNKGESTFTVEKQTKDSVVSWELIQPLVVEADKEKILSLARAIIGMKLTDYSVESKREQSGLDSPEATILCTMEDDSVVTLSLGQELKGDRFIEMSSMKGIYLTSAANIRTAIVTLDEIKKVEGEQHQDEEEDEEY